MPAGTHTAPLQCPLISKSQRQEQKKRFFTIATTLWPPLFFLFSPQFPPFVLGVDDQRFQWSAALADFEMATHAVELARFKPTPVV